MEQEFIDEIMADAAE